ncbi:uncharacterized protein PHALS_01800 [Plasmopara halstedii]|uniref:Uncharacterized protein n=1 Tax=Plasmopara halstedii TaxID=4781 RepID=A0A0P1AVH0_PLAHL|nr:uncharacterized protein PHALS_01800 [Plasmopara halstedii]CEG45509.1 hypothetical protein PHALS_01800 [Plasmopara halstedii]|eukprot:XP_024581878.1 hypothetical protein PHALS_01800 [Plasmopara halstedii]
MEYLSCNQTRHRFHWRVSYSTLKYHSATFSFLELLPYLDYAGTVVVPVLVRDLHVKGDNCDALLIRPEKVEIMGTLSTASQKKTVSKAQKQLPLVSQLSYSAGEPLQGSSHSDVSGSTTDSRRSI